jgi:phospholipid/cholesterol/gamma-HCH transport system substrate-binding protein
MTNFRAGLAVVLAFVAVVWFAFARPDRSPGSFEVRAVFSSVTGLRPGLSPVRIAGVEVGRVTAVRSSGGTRRAVVTMRLHDEGLPLHVDATMKLRPRLFLEGNSFIEMHPGSPGAAVARSGFKVPLRQTAVAVTFPHVLGALDADTRLNLQRTIQAWGQALTTADTGTSLNSALHNAAIVMPQSAVLSDASTGRERGDLARAIDGFGRTARALDDAGPQLGQLFNSLRRSSAAFAAESDALTSGLRELPGALRSTRVALREAGTAMGPATALARASVASLPTLPAAFRSGVPWLAQLRPLLSEAELGSTLDSLLPATRSLAGGLRPTASLFGGLDLLAGCSNRVLIPTSNAQISDGPRTAGISSWGELLSAFVGMSSVAQNYDGNGFFLRGHPGGGTTPVDTPKARYLDQEIYGHALAPPLATRPAAPASAPALRSDVACRTQSAPDLNGPGAAPGPADGGG